MGISIEIYRARIGVFVSKKYKLKTRKIHIPMNTSLVLILSILCLSVLSNIPDSKPKNNAASPTVMFRSKLARLVLQICLPVYISKLTTTFYPDTVLEIERLLASKSVTGIQDHHFLLTKLQKLNP